MTATHIRTATEGNAILKGLCEKAGMEFKPIYAMRELNQKIAELRDSPPKPTTPLSKAAPKAQAPVLSAGLFAAQTGTFESACQMLHQGGLTKSQSVLRAIDEFPNLHTAYKARGGPIFPEPRLAANASFEDAVNFEVGKGSSRGDAIRNTISRRPELYSAWRAGNTAKL